MPKVLTDYFCFYPQIRVDDFETITSTLSACKPWSVKEIEELAMSTEERAAKETAKAAAAAAATAVKRARATRNKEAAAQLKAAEIHTPLAREPDNGLVE
jgi:hypothetical protein